MAMYRNSEELNGHTLKLYDVLKLGDITLMVKETHLCKCENGTYENVFEFLGIKDPWTFCSDAFCYKVEKRKGDTCPEYKPKDFSAATRLARAFLEAYEKKIANAKCAVFP